jgi:hypothetical protein
MEKPKNPNLPPELDRRRKLMPEDKEHIRYLLSGEAPSGRWSMAAIGRMYNVSGNCIRRAIVLTDEQRKAMKKKHYELYEKPKRRTPEGFAHQKELIKKSRKRKYALMHKEMLEYGAARRALPGEKEKIHARNVSYWARNREKLMPANRRYYQEHKDELNAAGRERSQHQTLMNAVDLWKKNGKTWMLRQYRNRVSYIEKILKYEPLLILIESREEIERMRARGEILTFKPV